MNEDQDQHEQTERNRLTERIDLSPPLDAQTPSADRKAGMPLPGIIAIGLYMLVLATVVTFGVIGHHLPKLMLILAPLFATASFGLLRMFRWAWALTLSAVCLLMTYNLWIFLEQKQAPGAIQGLLNMVFFLYLVRADVRSRLQ
jgi:hypothetical protein